MTTSGGSDLVAFRRTLRRCAPQLRRDLPWIEDERPWAILVSEVMLQQTSTSRVVEPWRRFLEQFPTPSACANAPLSRVLVAWAGLGYPRRAKALHDAARVLRDDHADLVPRERADLLKLPGVGEYTASAVASFAYGQRVAILDTNVGRVLARAITNRTLSAKEAKDVATNLLPRSDVASFNQAMLDLGAQYCRSSPRCHQCPLAARCAWHRDGGDDPAPTSAAVSRRQAAYEGSNRQLRGRVLGALRHGPQSLGQLNAELGVDASRRNEVLNGLISDGLVECRSSIYRLMGDSQSRHG